MTSSDYQLMINPESFRNLSRNQIIEKVENARLQTVASWDYNLGEYPIALTSKSLPIHIDDIRYEDTIIHDGLEIHRKWIVEPSEVRNYGSRTNKYVKTLPTASTLKLLFTLFQLWKLDNYSSPIINFGSMYHLLDVMGQSKGPKNYNRIRRDFDTLRKTSIRAVNCFWDNTHKQYIDSIGFNLISMVVGYKEKPQKQEGLPMSYCIVSEVLWDSVIKQQNLYSVPFSLSEFYRLKPIEQRLALYLSKMLPLQKFTKRNLVEFASQIPIKADSKYKAKQLIKFALDTCVDKISFFSGYEFDGDTIIFHRQLKPKREPEKEPLFYKLDEIEELRISDMIELTNSPESKRMFAIIARKFNQIQFDRLFSTVKGMVLEGKTKSPGAFLVHTAKELAQEYGIDLGIREKG